MLSGAWLIHTAAWFLPVVEIGDRFPHGLPGLQAWLVSFFAVFPSETKFDTWYDRGLVIVSAVSTLLFVLGSPWVIWRGSHSLRLASAWAAVSAFIINSHWYVLDGAHRSQLRIGYFLWWLSFMVLGIGLFDSARRHNMLPTQQKAAA